MKVHKGKSYAAAFMGILGLILSMGSSEALATSYRLVETIDMTGYDILNIGTDGSNLLILNNGSPDSVKIVDLSGSLVNSFNTPSKFNSGITLNGSMIVFANGSDASNKYLREMDPSNGTFSGPLSPNMGSVMGLGYDGTHILVSYYANGSNGILTTIITKVHAINYTIDGTISVTVDTGTSISATPTYGVAWHNDNLFISFQAVDKVYQFDANLNLIEEIPIITEWPRGITFIKEDLFVADRGAQKIYRYEPYEPLMSDSETLSAGTGGTVNFTLDAGVESANRKYLLLGSTSGTDPGTPLPGGMVTLPLNWDLFTNIVISMLNTSIFSNFMGKLDSMGSARATLDTIVPLPPSSVGLTMNFAYALNNPWDFVSNPVAIEIVP